MASDRDEDKPFQEFRKLWYSSVNPSIWCVKYQHPMHRHCPVRLGYERMPEPFRSRVQPGHEGKTGDTVHLTPTMCWGCKYILANGGICDPL